MLWLCTGSWLFLSAVLAMAIYGRAFRSKFRALNSFGGLWLEFDFSAVRFCSSFLSLAMHSAFIIAAILCASANGSYAGLVRDLFGVGLLSLSATWDRAEAL